MTTRNSGAVVLFFISNGMSYSEAAKFFGVSEKTLFRLLNGNGPGRGRSGFRQKRIYTDMRKGTKRCTCCNTIKGLNSFTLHKCGRYPTYASWCKECHHKRADKLKIEYKNKWMRILRRKYGNIACGICGYNRCFEAIDGHHIDKNNKEYTLRLFLQRKPSEKYVKELDNIVLLCRNCHAEVHANAKKSENSQCRRCEQG